MTIVVALRRAILGLLAVVALGLVGIGVYVGYCFYTLPLPHPLAGDAPAAITYLASAGQPLAVRGVYRGEALTAGHLPRDLANAVVAIEDRRFFSHGAIDLRGVLRAGWHDLFDAGTVEGGSTITQQLARLTYLSPERTLKRKVREAVIAYWLEARLSKEEILTRYLNTVYFGAGAFGADAAARRYFGKPAGQLDLTQSAMLAGLIRSPSQLAPSHNLEAARRRADQVLQAMVETGAIDEAQAGLARAEPVRLAVAPETEPDTNYFIDTAAAEIKKLAGNPPLDLSATTTLEPRLQDAAERAVKRWLGTEGGRRHVGQAALVALAPDGAVLAMVGGRDYQASQFNRATQALRQPGSLFKIFVYLTALSSGYSPDSVIVDQPVDINGWTPANYDGHYWGPVSLETGFAHSLNSVSAQLVQAIGVDRVIAMAKSLGVHSELPAVPSLALGSGEVTLEEMTAAMDAIANDRRSVAPYTIRAIRSEAAPLYTRSETAAERPAWNWPAMMRLLHAVVSQGTGRAARVDRPAGGKTGTTDDYRDAWFVGFTDDITVGVWVGNDDHSPMDRVVGGDIPAKIWHDFVSAAEPIMAQRNAPASVGPLLSSAAPDASGQPLRGVPIVVDTATLMINGNTVHLAGITGQRGAPANALARYIAGRPVACTPADPSQQQYRCLIGDYDLSEAIVLNGAAGVTADASGRLRSAEEQARLAGRGMWGSDAPVSR